MKQQIVENISNPAMLERLYRENRQAFSKSFAEVAGSYDSELVRFWTIRLAPDREPVATPGAAYGWLVVVVLALFTGLLVKLPAMFPQISEAFFYPRNLALIVFNGIILFTFWQNRTFDRYRVLAYGLIVVALALYVNMLPQADSDSVMLALIHVPLFLWCIYGLAYISFDYRNTTKRIEYIRYNGEFIVMTGLILIAGGLFTAISINLFAVVKLNIELLYTRYVVVFGGVAAPIVASHLIRLYPNLTSKIAPVIARVFTPLVLVTMVVYLVVLLFSRSSILADRSLLLLFNVMLLAVMAIIVFSVSELDKLKQRNPHVLVLLLLAALAVVINSIALTAIVTRVADGLTPNRAVVLVSNILIFVNLILLANSLYASYFKGKPLAAVEQRVARYLTVYFIWTVVVIFILPFIFGLR